MLKKISRLAVLVLLVPTLALAEYTVVLKDGTKYRAKEKWTVRDGKARIALTNGQTLALDPKLIDEKASAALNSSGYGDASVIGTSQPTESQKAPTQSPLGSLTTLRKDRDEGSDTKPVNSGESTGVTNLTSDVLSRFQAAYDNIGLYDATVKGAGTNRLRVELTADAEDQVFKAISATAFLITKVPAATSETVDEVELYMRTINGGSAGRFHMSVGDAAAINSKQLTWQDYYIQKVLF